MQGRKPKLIFFDGKDGNGKTESLQMVSAMLTKDVTFPILSVRFPGYDEMGKVTRPHFLECTAEEHTKLFMILSEFALFLRDYHAGKFDDYDVVLVDRFILSTIHQVVVKPELISVVKEWLVQHDISHITYVVPYVDKDIARARLLKRGTINAGDEKVLAEYEQTDFLKYAEELMINITPIDNNGSKDELYDQLKSKLGL